MKKLLYFLPILIMLVTSCGSGDSSTEETTDEAEMTGVVTDLTEYGFNYVITLPDGEGSELQIKANDWGGVDIVKGESFMLSIAFGEGNLELLKGDLTGDPVYKAEIIEESASHLLYKREIPDSGIEPEYHFMYISKAGSEVFEIQNIKDASFNEEMIRKMLLSAKSFKAKAGA